MAIGAANNPAKSRTEGIGKFSGKYEHRVIDGGVGHNLPQEPPQAFAQAVIDADSF